MALPNAQGVLPLGHNFREPSKPRGLSFEERLAGFLHEVKFGQISFEDKIRHLGKLAETPNDMEKLIAILSTYG